MSKRLDLSKSSFIANETEYHFSSRLSLNRWVEFEKHQIKLGFGKDFESILKHLQNAVDMANKGKGIEAWNTIYNIITSVGDKLENRMDTALHIAALFINTKDEDDSKVDNALFNKKIEDWKKEGYDSLDFFQLAANLVTGFVESLQRTSLATLEAQPTSRKK